MDGLGECVFFNIFGGKLLIIAINVHSEPAR